MNHPTIIQQAFERLLRRHATLRAAAKAHDISEQYLSNARCGNVRCGPKVLRALGLAPSFARVRK